jgi:hypothetical protein
MKLSLDFAHPAHMLVPATLLSFTIKQLSEFNQLPDMQKVAHSLHLGRIN